MTANDRCACGPQCASLAHHQHHVFTQQQLRDAAAYARRDDETAAQCLRRLAADERNMIGLAYNCHFAHHNRSAVLPLRCLPDAVFEFGREVFGPGRAHGLLARYYRGRDPRHDALLDELAGGFTS